MCFFVDTFNTSYFGVLLFFTKMYIAINELEKDVLREIINIGLARAADSFANFSNNAVLLAVPEIRIIEPRVLPEVIQEFEEKYQIIRSEIEGELSGKVFLLFSESQSDLIAEVCLDNSNQVKSRIQKELLITRISEIITKALAEELHHLLQVNVQAIHPVPLFDNKYLPIKYILKDLPAHQPFVIAIKTQFKKMVNSVEMPVIIVLHAHSISKLLHIIRRDNLYEFKLLQEKE